MAQLSDLYTGFIPVTHVVCCFGVCRSKSVSRIPRIIDRSALRYVERKKDKEREREREREREKNHGYRNHHFPNWLAIRKIHIKPLTDTD